MATSVDGFRAHHPRPPSRDEVDSAIRRHFPEPDLAAQLTALIRPSIHLLPGTKIDPLPTSLRLGGLPYVPADWSWPRVNGEPLLFIGQFECTALAPHVAGALLPADGTLAFFGGPDITDDTVFSDRAQGITVAHWAAGTALHLADAPQQDFRILPLSGVLAVDVYELPRYGEPEIRAFARTHEMSRRLSKLRDEIEVSARRDGAGAGGRTPTKLLGWPDGMGQRHDQVAPKSLLLQVGPYDNGEAEHTSVAKGRCYFSIGERDLAEQRFDEVELEIQFSIPANRRSCFPLPPARSRANLEQEVLAKYPDEFGRHLAAQIRPALLAWPRPAPADAMASRLGGKPLAPKDWEWPTYEDEPMLFVAQINCAELKGDAARLLPREGLLCFFAAPDIAAGSDFGGDTAQGAVFHWPVGTELVPHEPPEPGVEILLSASMEFLESFTLPPLFSETVGERANDRDFRTGYPDTHGIALLPQGRKPDMSDSTQLLGWHHPVQGELSLCEDPGWRLLLQVGTYDDGEKDHWWGPGGTIYFMIREEDLAAGDFSNVAFDGQHT